MKSSYDKPRLTRDGLTVVKYCVNSYPWLPGIGRGARIRPEQKLEHIVSLVDTMELTNFADIYEWREPELWEFMYLNDRCYNDRDLPARWEKYCEYHRQLLGAWRITGNFVELSHVFEIETRDPAVLERFRALFAKQPPRFHECRREWEQKCEESWAKWRRRYEGKTFEEVYCEIQSKASSHIQP